MPPRSQLEQDIQLRQLPSANKDCFTNVRQLWHPPGRRGVYGGILIAHVTPEAPVVYNVIRLHDEEGRARRTVQVFQHQKLVFQAMISLVEMSPSRKQQKSNGHIWSSLPKELHEDLGHNVQDELEGTPFRGFRVPHDDRSAQDDPSKKHIRKWIKAREAFSGKRYSQTHVEALAYLSDMYFIGTAAEAHSLERIDLDADENMSASPGPKISMMVTLSHSIYFHNTDTMKADEWILSDMESPWAGDGRALVLQHMYDDKGQLMVTAVQEGIVRLQQRGNL